MKKFLSLLICFIMAFSTVAFAAPEESSEQILTDFFNTYKDILFLDSNAKVEVAFLADIDNDKEPELVVSAGAYFYGLSIYKVQDGTVKLHDTITCERGTGINENYGFLLDNNGHMTLYKDNTNAQIPSDYTIYTFTEYDLAESSSVPTTTISITIPTDETKEATCTITAKETFKTSAEEAKVMVELFKELIAPYTVWSREANSNYIDLETIWNRQKAFENSVSITLQIGNPDININGIWKTVDEENVPVIKNKRTLVPEEVIKELGGMIYKSADGEITIGFEGNTIKLAKDSNIAVCNGNTVTLDTAPEIVNDTAMLPIRFIAESFGAAVEWEEATRKVIITKN